MEDELSKLRQKNQQANIANAVADDLGVSLSGLASMVGATEEAVQKGLLDCLERNRIYKAAEERDKQLEREQGLDPDTCHNGVCPNCQQYEHEHTDPNTGLITFSGRTNYCTEGSAQGCIFRLKEHPYSDPFVDIPSHNECVRILQRIGYIRNDDFGKALGTDFMSHQAISKLWSAYIQLLVETGRVTIPEDEWKELSEIFSHNLEHARHVGASELAKEYFADRALPDDCATIGELIAHRNALLSFIRGEIDWPHGRCPCGEDVNWNGIAHTPNCRFKEEE